jgi:hypothetical protein
MGKSGMAVAVVLAVALSDGWAGDGAQDDRQRLVGVWKGNWGPLEITLAITPTEIAAVEQGKGDLGAGSWVIDPDRNFLDATRTRGPDARGTHLGIYQLEGDELKWCVNRPKQGGRRRCGRARETAAGGSESSSA